MKIDKSQGFTLIEILIVLAIFSLLIGAIGAFQRNVFEFNRFGYQSLETIQDGRAILRTMVGELRSASQANTGAYPIASVSSTSITFFTDTNSDNLKERIRYFIVGMTLRKGSIVPTGSPLTYNPANEVVVTLASNVKNATTTPLFEYFDENYAGGTTTPLTLPTSVTNIHLVKINLLLDVDPNKSPIPRTYTSQVNLRNLKDNL